MIGDRKTYTVPEESFLEWVPRGFWIGSKFVASAGLMQITAVGKSYIKSYMKGTQRLIDIETKEVESVPTAAEENNRGENA
jgi:hypothetical protein